MVYQVNCAKGNPITQQSILTTSSKPIMNNIGIKEPQKILSTKSSPPFSIIFT